VRANSASSRVSSTRRREAEVTAQRMSFYNHFGSLEQANLIAKLRYMATVEKCDFIFLDHISIVTSGMESSSEGERKDIDILMTKLASLVQETGVGIIAIVHLKRAKDKSFNEGSAISLNDLRGSAALEQLSFNVLALERDQQAEDDAKDSSIIRVLKCRETGDTGVADTLVYNRETRLAQSAYGLRRNRTSRLVERAGGLQRARRLCWKLCRLRMPVSASSTSSNRIGGQRRTLWGGSVATGVIQPTSSIRVTTETPTPRRPCCGVSSTSLRRTLWSPRRAARCTCSHLALREHDYALQRRRASHRRSSKQTLNTINNGGRMSAWKAFYEGREGHSYLQYVKQRYAPFIRAIQDRFEAGDLVLELGAGTGTITKALCEGTTAVRYVASDIDPEMVQIARQRLSDDNVAVFVDSAHSSSTKADVVHSHGMLEHFNDDAIRECIRQLQPRARSSSLRARSL
jgi:hypothetical protein